MTERKSAASSILVEQSPIIAQPVKKSRIIMNQIFETMIKQVQDQTETSSLAPVEIIRRPALPDGTGQIINIGI